MRVIVMLEAGKFHDGSGYIYPEQGEEIDLPDEMAESEIAAGNVVLPGELESALPGRKKKAAAPEPDDDPDEDEDEGDDPEEDDEPESEPPKKKKKKKKKKAA